MFSKSRQIVWATAMVMLLVLPGWAQSPPAATRFDIKGFSVLGASQLARDDISRITAPFVGRQKTPSDVLKAQQALQQAYIDLGDCSTQVWAPRDEPEAGVVTFRLVQTPTALSRDCVPTVVLDKKPAVPLAPIAPGEVATRPLVDVTGTTAEAAAPAEPKTVIARAAVKPLQDAPAVKPLQDRPAVAPAIAIAQAPVTGAPVSEAEKTASVVVALAPKQEPASSTPSIAAPVPSPKVETPVQAGIATTSGAKPDVKPTDPVVREIVPPLPQVVVTVPKMEPAPVTKVEVAPQPEIVAAKTDSKPEAKPPVIVAATPKPEPAPQPKVEVSPQPEVVAVKPVPPVPVPQVVAVAPIAEPAPTPKVEVSPQPEVVAVKPELAPAPRVVVVAPKPEPAPQPKVEVSPQPEIVAVKPEPAPAPKVVAVAPKSEPAPTPKVELVSKTEVVATPAPNADVGSAAAQPEVVVRPLADASIQAVPPPVTAQPKQEVERAAVRPLQDRPEQSARSADVPVPAATTPSVAATSPKPAAPVAEKIAQSTAVKPDAKVPALQERNPAKQSVPILVQAPPDSAEPVAVQGEDAATAALRFDIARYLIVGNTMLKPAEINQVLRAYTGRQKDFADVQRALESLQTAYSDKGFSAVQVTLPEQELERGEVRFEVVETRLGKIDVQGNELHSERNVRNSVPALREGVTPNSIEIARNLKLANENASKQTQVSLRAGSQDGEVDATVKLIEDDPVKYSMGMDNTGTYATGKYRVSFGYQNANTLNRDHTLTLQYITSPEHPSAVTVFGFGYRVPLYGSGNSIDFIAGYSDVASGTIQQLFNVSGAGTIFGLRYNQNFNRIDNYEHKLIYGLDYKAFKNNVTFVGSTTPLVPDVTIHPVSITYSGLWRGTSNQFDFYASYSQNVFPGGNDGANSDFQERKPGYPNPARAEAKAGYNIIRAGANYTQQIWGEWQARTVFAIQQTDAALIAGEQFGAGGADSVRGFEERYVSNDRGWRANFELYTPDIAGNLGWTGGRVKLLGFYDTADLTRNRRQPGEAGGTSISSYGMGLRLQTKSVFSMRVDYAQVYHDGETENLTPRFLKDGRRNANTVHASMVWVF